MNRDIKYIGMDVHKEATVIAVLTHLYHGGSVEPARLLRIVAI